MTEENQAIAGFVVQSILTLVGLWLGWSFAPKLFKRIQIKEIYDREMAARADDVKATKIYMDVANKGERAPKFCDEYKGKQAPPDIEPPNKGGNDE